MEARFRCGTALSGVITLLDSVRRTLLAVLAAAALLAAPTTAIADEYESERAGHPLRIAGYVLHPIGVIIDTLSYEMP